MGFHWVGMRSALNMSVFSIFYRGCKPPKSIHIYNYCKDSDFSINIPILDINKHKKPFYLTLQSVSVSCLWSVKSLPKFSYRVV